MPKRMLIDASHPEETRVVVLDGQRVDEFDFEAASKRPLKGNIYLAKVTRVEPSLQAAFVEYGGNRQGFLAFSEIHPDYYQIPVADRQALLAEQQEEARRHADDEFESVATGTAIVSDEELEAESEGPEQIAADPSETASAPDATSAEQQTESAEHEELQAGEHTSAEIGHSEHHNTEASSPSQAEPDARDEPEGFNGNAGFSEGEPEHEHLAPEQSGGDESQDAKQPAQPMRTQRPSHRWVRKRHYKIQEVIKRKQIMLVQVVKEERGTKGAALTTFLSLAGRYCVLMPNTPRGGGISRKITNAADRNRLKAAAATLELPEGMGLIIRTAGANRTKLEIKRDYEYLLRLWDQIRELTLQSNAPACVYEEGDIIKRAIRDLYNKDVSEIVVEGEEGYKNAKDFMRMLMPSHAKNVKLYRDPVPVFQRHHIEAQLDAMFQPTVTLKSGGYIVINQTEALVSIDVNSGRATREHSIEETAHKTNLEAADEIGRQLRLRDLAGLIVIDFIDMEDSRNDRDVEKRMRDAVKNDRARVQIGKISQFGLLEMSRQRLRAGVVASSTIPCPHCGGQGIVRSVESTALRVLRAVEEEGERGTAATLKVRVADDVALYTLNQKRRELARIETDYDVTIIFEPKADLTAGDFELERSGQRAPSPAKKSAVSADTVAPEPLEAAVEEQDASDDAEGEIGATTEAAGGEQPQSNGHKRRRRRRRGRGGSRPPEQTVHADEIPGQAEAVAEVESVPVEEPPAVVQELKESSEQGEAEQSVGSAPRRRRRRRRTPRAGELGSPGTTGAEAEHAQDRDSAGQISAGESDIVTAPPATADDRFSSDGVSPNAPSAPVWSLTGEEAHESAHIVHDTVGEMYYRRDEELDAQAVPPSPVPEPVSVQEQAPSEASAGEQSAAEGTMSTSEASPSEAKSERRGWWQRQFRRS